MDPSRKRAMQRIEMPCLEAHPPAAVEAAVVPLGHPQQRAAAAAAAVERMRAVVIVDLQHLIANLLQQQQHREGTSQNQ